MPLSRFIFNYILISMLVIFTACEDIERDNILDPKNPGSYRALTTMVEAFVNTENDQLYNQYMISALNNIKAQYGDKVVIAHFHRDAGAFADSLAVRDNDILYEKYIDQIESEKGVPDVFINGPDIRIKGASSAGTALQRIEAQLQPLLIENSHFTIEPSLKRENGAVSISVELARLGSQAAEELFLRLVITENLDNNYQSHVVRLIQVSNLIPDMEPGERKTVSFPNLTIDRNPNLKAVIMVISNKTLQIFQTIEVSLP